MFVSHNHNGLIKDIKTIFIHKSDSTDPSRREEFWQANLRTLALDDLNIED